jgi:putative spermidine/putrescine transport system permease protein
MAAEAVGGTLTRDTTVVQTRAFGSVIAWLGYLFLILPSIILVPISLGNKNELVFPPQHFSLDLYQQFFSDPTWLQPLAQSFRVAGAATLVALFLGVPAAYGLTRTEFRGKSVAYVFLLSPMLIPVIALALGLDLYFSYIKIVGTTLGLVLAHSIFVMPFVLITVRSGLQLLDARVEVAAEMMGASRIRVLLSVVLPQLVPSIIAAAIFAFLVSFDEVVIAWFISGVQTATLPVRMYSSVQFEVSPIIAAISTLLTTFSLIACIVAAWGTRAPQRHS